MSRDATLYVDDMIEACRRVLQYSDGLGRAQLVSGTMAHDAVLRSLEVLGEAGKNVPVDVPGLDDDPVASDRQPRTIHLCEGVHDTGSSPV